MPLGGELQSGETIIVILQFVFEENYACVFFHTLAIRCAAQVSNAVK